MHDGQLGIDELEVRRLIDEQFPDWASMPIRRVHGTGTVNAIFRIGDNHAARFPLTGADVETVAETLRCEATALAEFAEASPFATPVPVALGQPGGDYPLPWSVQTWVPGDVATPESVSRSPEFAHDLARLIRTLREADPHGRGFSGLGRGGDLKDSDEWMELCFTQSTDMLPVDELRALWADLRTLPEHGSLAIRTAT